MAARESQGLQIALIIFVILSIATSVTTYLAFTNFKESEKKMQAESQKATEATTKRETAETENQNLRLLISGAATDDWTKIHDSAFTRINNDFAALNLGALPDDQKNLYKVIDQLTSTVRKSYTDVESRDKDVKLLKSQLDDEGRKAAAKLKEVEAARDAAVAELDKERTNYNTAKEALKTEKETLVQEKGEKAKQLQELDASYKSKMTDLTAQLKTARDDVATVKNELKKYYHLDPSASGGTVTWINQRDNMAYINLGWDDGLHRRITFSVYPAGTTDVAKSVAKGKIEVVNVTGPHEAEARIVENPINNPLLPRDMIHTQGWHPGQHEHFGINGFIDIDGASVDETRKLVDLITSNGGIVDAKMVEVPGSEGKKAMKVDGQMTVNTRYLIVGDMLADTPAKSERINTPASTQLAKEATRLNIETIGLQKFLSMMGYTPHSSAPAGAAAPGAAAAGADDNGGFRPRKPPARGKDDSAF